MKKIILSAAIFALSTSLYAQKTIADVAKFATEVIDQGKLKVNEPKEVKFIVTNISKEPLIIETATPGCGCTMGDYTKSPIAPGATGFISAKFNAASVGHFNKSLTVKFAGVDETKNINITGDVLDAEAYDKWVAENPDKKNETVNINPSFVPASASQDLKPAQKTKAPKSSKTTKSAIVNKGS